MRASKTRLNRSLKLKRSSDSPELGQYILKSTKAPWSVTTHRPSLSSARSSAGVSPTVRVPRCQRRRSGAGELHVHFVHYLPAAVPSSAVT